MITMPLKKLNVGKVVYILSSKAQAVLPALVIKEHRTTHLHGEEVTWTIQYGPPAKQKIIESHKIDGELFGTLEEVRDVMNAQFHDFVESLVDNAFNLQNKWYPQTKQPQSVSQTEKIDPEDLLKEMEEPSPVSRPQVSPQNNSNRRRIYDREDLKAALAAEDGDGEGDFDEQGFKMKLKPDGTIDME